jgi:hypothetical protein
VSEGKAFALFVGGGLIGIIALIGAVMALVVVPIGKHYDKAACHTFGDRSNREVRFVTYTYWSWDCLTPTVDGKWISTSRLRDVD